MSTKWKRLHAVTVQRCSKSERCRNPRQQEKIEIQLMENEFIIIFNHNAPG